MSEVCDKAQKKQDELSERILSSIEIMDQRPVFHFATPGGWCNDPNGFSQFGNRVHLFYQYHPYSTQWGPMYWGHVVSDDMLSWELKPVALAPDSTADCKGCFSGTALEHEGKHILAYTGVSNNGTVDIQNQCIAIGDGCVYEKLSENPVLTASDIPFEYNIEHFRDPKIWNKDGMFYMICVLKRKDDRGAMVMFQSDDAKKWSYKGMIDSSKDGLSNMWECPDVSVIDGKDCLIFSPQEVKEDYNLGFHDGNNSIYVTGKFDYENAKFTREVRPENGYTAALVDYGIDFYAPETTRLKDGRTIMIGWMQAWESYITPENYIWSGMMTLPRELSFRNNRLYQLPVHELENWKKDKKTGTLQKEGEASAVYSGSRQFELALNLADSKGTVKIRLGDAEHNVVVEIDTDEGFISFDRTNTATPGAIPFRKAKLRTECDAKNLRIICDTCSLEVFVDDGIMAFTNAFFLENKISDLVVENFSSKNITYDFWKIECKN